MLAHGAICWLKSKFGWVKCNNMDAVIFAFREKIGFGCVLWNLKGFFFTAKCVGMIRNFGVREAEALGIWEALSLLKVL